MNLIIRNKLKEPANFSRKFPKSSKMFHKISKSRFKVPKSTSSLTSMACSHCMSSSMVILLRIRTPYTPRKKKTRKAKICNTHNSRKDEAWNKEFGSSKTLSYCKLRSSYHKSTTTSYRIDTTRFRERSERHPIELARSTPPDLATQSSSNSSNN